MSFIRTALTAAAVGTLAVALSGCSISVVDNAADKPAAETPTTETQTSSTDQDTAQEEPDAETPASDDDIDALIQDAEGDGASVVQRCDGELTLLDNGSNVRVEGHCDRLILNMTGSIINAEDVDYLSVIGDGNAVFVGEVDEVLVNGSGNIVTWTGATPSVKDVGTGNVLKAR